MSFHNKNILIVGASSGVGYTLAKNLISLGANVITASRTQPDLTSKFINLDIQNFDSQVFNELPNSLDGLVYCPGTINLKPFNRLSNQDFLQDFQINLLGAVNVIQANLIRLKSTSNASIVLFSTVAVQTGMSFHASIAASKGAIEGLTKSLAAEFASSKIRVNAVAPSLTNTPLAKNLLSTPEKIEASNKRHPIGRVGESEDIASIAKLLLSDEGSWITGQIFHVDGGMSSLRMM